MKRWLLNDFLPGLALLVLVVMLVTVPSQVLDGINHDLAVLALRVALALVLYWEAWRWLKNGRS